MSPAPSTSPSRVVQAALALATEHHAKYDPSHDIHHVQRVTLLALSIARSIPSSSSSPLPPVDLLVVHLAALTHDLLDAKYLPPGADPSAAAFFKPFWAQFSEEEVSEEQRRLVENVVENVSYSKEKKRRAAGLETDWHRECRELHCVQDADKLDAIGAFGILRCAAYSGAVSRPLYVGSLPSSTSTPSVSSSLPPSQGNSAIDHFHDKLFHLEGLMKTEKGKELARKRTETMKRFVEDVEREWEEAVGGESVEHGREAQRKVA
ncbi:hypothetical protein JCM8547_002632 [Rhodosporidiobolus lusitaniae]